MAVMTIYMVMQLFISVAEEGNSVDATKIEQVQGLLQPAGTDVSALENIPLLGGAYSLITNVWDYCKGVIEIIFLWSPSLWSGNWYWFWLLFCLPVAVGMVASLVFILRGVPSL